MLRRPARTGRGQFREVVPVSVTVTGQPWRLWPCPLKLACLGVAGCRDIGSSSRGLGHPNGLGCGQGGSGVLRYPAAPLCAVYARGDGAPDRVRVSRQAGCSCCVHVRILWVLALSCGCKIVGAVGCTPGAPGGRAGCDRKPDPSWPARSCYAQENVQSVWTAPYQIE